MSYVIYYADCPRCDRPVALHNPARGDGSTRITYRHKDLDGDWCRAEVPEGWRKTRRTDTTETR